MSTEAAGKPFRAFIAIRLPQPVIDRLAQQQAAWRGVVPSGTVTWVNPDLLHITVRFLGDVRAEQVAGVVGVMDSLNADAFSLALGRTGAFPNPRRPRVLWAGVAGDLHAAHALRDRIDDRLSALGWPSDNHTFNPHITLGRVKRSRKLNRPPPLDEPLEPLPFRVKRVWLLRSDLRPHGPVYTPLHTIALRQAG